MERTRKISIVVISLAMCLLAVSTSSGIYLEASASKSPGNYEATIPSSYQNIQGILQFCTTFEANNFHYSNTLAGGGGPSMLLTVNAGYLRAEREGGEINLDAGALNFTIATPPIPVQIAGIQAAGSKVKLHVSIHTPDADGIVGTITAKLKGRAKFHVHVPGLPSYDYEGNEMTITMTFIEPDFTVTVTPSRLTITQGTMGVIGTTAVTVTALHYPEVTSTVNLFFNSMGRPIFGSFSPSNTGTPNPIMTRTLTISVNPLPIGIWQTQVRVYDSATGVQRWCILEIEVIPP